MQEIYYVYLYLNPLKPRISSYKYKDLEINVEFEPFYIGKGKLTRDIDHLREKNKRKDTNLNKVSLINNIISSGKEVMIIRPFENLSEENAYSIERTFERIIGRQNMNKGPLLNVIPGGKLGKPKSEFAEDFKNKISKSLIEFYQKNPEARKQTGEKVKKFYQENGVSEEWKDHLKGISAYRKGNVEYYKENGKKIKKFYETHVPTRAITIYQYDLNKNFIEEFPSAYHAAKELSLNVTGIRRAANGIKSKSDPTYKGFIWSLIKF